MKYIKRDLEEKIEALSKEYACILITGPRQVGKTTMLKNLMDEEREYVTLDDLEERRLAKTEPALFMQMHKMPIFIDEVQYAPEIFRYLKMYVDKHKIKGSFALIGSQAFELMKNVSETLAGRMAIIELKGLSLREMHGIEFYRPFVPNEEYMEERKKILI